MPPAGLQPDRLYRGCCGHLRDPRLGRRLLFLPPAIRVELPHGGDRALRGLQQIKRPAQVELQRIRDALHSVARVDVELERGAQRGCDEALLLGGDTHRSLLVDETS